MFLLCVLCISAVIHRFWDRFYIDAHMIHDAIRRRGSFNLIHLATMYKVDVFIPKQRPFDRAAFGRTVLTTPFEGSDQQFPVAAAEDVILSMLEWYRAGGERSERQWHDILGIIKVQRELLSREHLEHWARELGVSDLLRGRGARRHDDTWPGAVRGRASRGCTIFVIRYNRASCPSPLRQPRMCGSICSVRPGRRSGWRWR